MFSLGQSSIDPYQDKHSNLDGFEYEVGVNGKDLFRGLRDFVSFDPFFSDFRPSVEELPRGETENKSQFSPDFRALDDLYINCDALSFHPWKHDSTTKKKIDDPEKENPRAVPLASFGILKDCRRGFKRLNGPRILPEPQFAGRRLSMEDLFRFAGKEFVKTSSRKVTSPSHQFGGPLLCLSADEVKGVKLVQYLLAAAEKFDKKQYDRARKFLSVCDSSSSSDGNPVQRIVYYFSKSLREKIDGITGRVEILPLCSLQKEAVFVDEAVKKADSVILTMYQEIPFTQVSIHAGMQAITEHVAGVKRVHVIDLEVRCGIHASVLMQALAGRLECPIDFHYRWKSCKDHTNPYIEASHKIYLTLWKCQSLVLCQGTNSTSI